MLIICSLSGSINLNLFDEVLLFSVLVPSLLNKPEKRPLLVKQKQSIQVKDWNKTNIMIKQIIHSVIS